MSSPLWERPEKIHELLEGIREAESRWDFLTASLMTVALGDQIGATAGPDSASATFQQAQVYATLHQANVTQGLIDTLERHAINGSFR